MFKRINSYTQILILLLNFSFYSHLLLSQNSFEQKRQLAQSYESAGEFESSARLYKELFYAKPTDDDAFVSSVRNLRRINDYQELLLIAEKRLQTKESFDAMELKAEMLYRNKRTEEANLLWSKIFEEYGNRGETYTVIAATQSNLQLFTQAISTLNKGREKLSDNNLYFDEVIKLYITTNDYKNGVNELKRLLLKRRDLPSVQGRIYAFMATKEAIDHIAKELDKFSDEKENDIAVQELYAWFLKTTKRNKEALEVTIRIDKLRNSAGYYIFEFAEIARKDEDFDLAIKAFEYLLDKDMYKPITPNALFGYAMTFESKYEKGKQFNKEKAEEIIARYNKILKESVNPNINADCLYRIAQIYLKIGKKEDCTSTLNTLRNRYPNTIASINGLFLLGDLELASSNFIKAREIFNPYNFQLQPDKVELAKLRLADIEFYQGNLDSANTLYSLVSRNLSSNVANDALYKQMLITNNKKNPSGLLVIAQADFKKFANDYKAGLSLLLQLKSNLKDEDFAEYLDLELIKTYYQLDSLDKVIAEGKKYLEEYLSSNYLDDVTYLIAQSQEQKGAKQDAIDTYTKLLSEYPMSIHCEQVRIRIRKLRDGV